MSCCPHRVRSEDILDLMFSIAPQFETTDPVKLASYERLIDALRCMVNERLLGCCATLAFANLLAHYLSIQSNPSLGVTNSMTEGQLSISYANTVNASFYSSTPYGQAFKQLISNVVATPITTNQGRRWVGPSCCGSYGFGFWP